MHSKNIRHRLLASFIKRRLEMPERVWKGNGIILFEVLSHKFDGPNELGQKTKKVDTSETKKETKLI